MAYSEYEDILKAFKVTREKEENINEILRDLRLQFHNGEKPTSSEYEIRVDRILFHLDSVNSRYAAESFLKYLAKEKDEYTDVYINLYSGMAQHDEFIKENNLH